MSRRFRDTQARLRAIGGQRKAVRAEQLRATGLSDRAIARRLSVPVEAVAQWFDLRDARSQRRGRYGLSQAPAGEIIGAESD
jgi:hypothetical protein